MNTYLENINPHIKSEKEATFSLAYNVQQHFGDASFIWTVKVAEDDIAFKLAI